jgi:hypothetical protein
VVGQKGWSLGRVGESLDGIVSELLNIAELESLAQLLESLDLVDPGSLERIGKLFLIVDGCIENREQAICCHDDEFGIKPGNPFCRNDRATVLVALLVVAVHVE